MEMCHKMQKSHIVILCFLIHLMVKLHLIQNVQPLDEGWYCCVAANEARSTTDSGWLEINSYCQAHGYPMAHNSNMQSYSLLIKYYT